MSDVPGSMSSDAGSLLLEAATRGWRLTDEELQQVLEHIARVGYDPDALEKARGKLAGLNWQGRTLRGRDMLPPAEAYYLRHVVAQREWPAGTTYEAYLDSIKDIIENPQSGVLISQFQGAWQLTIIGPSGAMQGPGGGDWIMVEYRLSTGHWITAFQPREGLRYLEMPERTQRVWLRRPH